MKTDNTQPKDEKLGGDLQEKIEELKKAEQEKHQENTTSKDNESALQQENAELKDKLLRCTADLQNIRRRADAERVKSRFDGAVSAITPLISLMDNFSRAFAHLPEDIKDHEFIASLQSLESSFSKTLEDEGVSFFGNPGDAFDAALHESMMVDGSAVKDVVAQVFERGVKYKDRVVRHAKVSVGSKE